MPKARIGGAIAVGLALFGVAGSAAARASVALRYERSEDASVCPDENGLRIEVARRLGYDPFVATAEDGRRVVASVDRAPSGEFRGHVRLEA